MQDDILPAINPWMDIPIADYEQHMSHSSVGQLSLLNLLTKKYLLQTEPLICLFIGIAGGNGLEHIDNNITKNVIGIDINQEYLEVAFTRHHHKINSLQLLQVDIAANTNQVCKADFVWAALVLEYTGVDKCLEFARNNILPGGHFIATIQASNKQPSVSPTNIESVKKAGSVFKAVDPKTMLAKAAEMGFKQISSEENQLPDGKTFLTFDLVYG